MIMLTRLLTQRLRHCSFSLRGAYVDSPYAIGLRKLTRLRVLLTQASYDTTPSTHIKGGFGRCLNDSKPLLNWFGGMPSARIFLYHPSTKTGVSLDGKNCTAGIERTEPWPCPSNFALRSIHCVRFRVKAHGSHHHRKQVQLAWGCAWKRFTASRWKMALRGEANHTLPSWGATVGQSLWKWLAFAPWEWSFWADKIWEHLLAETATPTATSRFNHFPHNTSGVCCHGMHPVGCLNIFCLNICFTFMMSPCVWAV